MVQLLSLLLLLTLLMPLPADAQTYSKYALTIGAPDPQPMCVITVIKMQGDNFTYANPPRGRIHIDEVLQGNLQPRDSDVIWQSPRIPLCGNDANPQESIRKWDATKIPPIPVGSKQIVTFSDSTAKTILYAKPMNAETASKIRTETAKCRTAYEARWEALQKLDVNRLVSNSTDIVACDTASSSIGSGMSVRVAEWLKDSAIDARPDRSAITISTNQLYGNRENQGKFILFLRASQTAFKWRKPEGYPKSLPGVCPNYMPAMHRDEYKRLAFVYHPISDPAWFIPLTSENLSRVKNAIASQKSDANATKGLVHRDVALEITQTNCLLNHIRRTTYVSSKDKPFTPQELQERERLVRKTISDLQQLFGKDNEDAVAKYEELKETLRRQGKQNEGVAALKMGKEMSARITARKLEPTKSWMPTMSGDL